MQTIQQRWLSR